MRKPRLFLQQYGVFFAWVISLGSTLSSLYFSEVLRMVPCTLCWYQRIFMYPLSIILGIATFREDKKIFYYAAPLALMGGGIALFHYIGKKMPLLQMLISCNVDVPCYRESFNLFGFVTIPLLSFGSFFLIVLLLWAAYPRKKARFNRK